MSSLLGDPLSQMLSLTRPASSSLTPFATLRLPDGQDVHQWIALYGDVTGAATDRLGRVRRACIAEMANTADSTHELS